MIRNQKLKVIKAQQEIPDFSLSHDHPSETIKDDQEITKYVKGFEAKAKIVTGGERKALRKPDARQLMKVRVQEQKIKDEEVN